MSNGDSVHLHGVYLSIRDVVTKGSVCRYSKTMGWAILVDLTGTRAKALILLRNYCC